MCSIPPDQQNAGVTTGVVTVPSIVAPAHAPAEQVSEKEATPSTTVTGPDPLHTTVPSGARKTKEIVPSLSNLISTVDARSGRDGSSQKQVYHPVFVCVTHAPCDPSQTSTLVKQIK